MLSSALRTSGLRIATTTAMQRCVGDHDGCHFVFYHDNLESDEFFSETVASNTNSHLISLSDI